MKLTITLPIKTVSEANAHEHWRNRQKRAKHQRGLTAMLCRNAFGKPPALPLRIRMVRVSARDLDSDNLAGSQKHTRDGVADWLGIDDRDARVEWVYAQERGKVAGVRVEIEDTGAVVVASGVTASCSPTS